MKEGRNTNWSMVVLETCLVVVLGLGFGLGVVAAIEMQSVMLGSLLGLVGALVIGIYLFDKWRKSSGRTTV